MPLVIQDHIVRLEISKNNVIAMELLNSQQNLTDIDSRFVFIEPFLYLEILRQIPSWAILQDQEKLILGLESKVQANYKWMADA